MKKNILEAVSRLRHYFFQVQTNLEAKTAVNRDLEWEVKARKEEIQRLKTNAIRRTRHVAQSLDTVRRETNCAGQVPIAVGKDRKLYSEAVQRVGRKEKRYRLMITSRTDDSVLSGQVESQLMDYSNFFIRGVGRKISFSLRDRECVSG